MTPFVISPAYRFLLTVTHSLKQYVVFKEILALFDNQFTRKVIEYNHFTEL